ncbi:MAG: hypothetical protein ACRDCE_08850 [Cetobacterium sp.]|uniref:hypothetical protein n=1 Tax=Cetobacterium sp. TaxID=2071632 RepID=UPI003EE5361E
MTLKEVFIMVSTYWSNQTGDEAFKNKLIYEAIINKQSRKSLKFLKDSLSPESFEFAQARIREIHK